MGTPSNNKDKIKYTRPIVEIGNSISLAYHVNTYLLVHATDKSSNSTEILGYCARASSQNVLVSYKVQTYSLQLPLAYSPHNTNTGFGREVVSKGVC